MFVLIEVEDRSIKTLACGYSYEETKEKLKVRFAQCVEDCGFDVSDVEASLEFNRFDDERITTVYVEEAVMQLIEIAKMYDCGISADYSDEWYFSFDNDNEAEISTIDRRFDWRIIDTNGIEPEEIGDFVYILDFIKGNEDLRDNETAKMQLKSLWTAFCLRRNIDVDTNKYDQLICDMWFAICANSGGVYKVADLNKFDAFMCEWLV